ncbi:hypothetical protein ACFSTH_15040 [Paenibacillus yanchengensis]|uniref:Six-hairpin glycosidase n=1 Tax=Paenibacillus yanchengensis TaxID=2035833 RepID=A0ABW4YH81_9BACL
MGYSSDSIRFVDRTIANLDYHHGQLRPVIGVQSRQVMRASRFEDNEESSWTYNHAPMLAYWQGLFYLQYLSCPVHEHVPPGKTLLVTSADGYRWSQPTTLFPTYKLESDHHYADGEVLLEGTDALMHQRMGFYVADNGCLLALAFYGFCPTPKISPNNGKGIGRVVRQINADGSFGEIYFIRLNEHAGWTASNVNYPLYTESPDAAFVAACEQLLDDKIATQQWWEEDRSSDGFYTIEGGTAFSSYPLADGKRVGLWKHSKYAFTEDEGLTWTPMKQADSLIMAGGKVWGERMEDERYALVYNPSPIGNHRWPLALVSSEDGLQFREMLVVNGEVPPRRYFGYHKNYGMSYTRGIEATDATSPNGNMWVTYSSNKEDIWISEVPVPIRSAITGVVHDNFNHIETDKAITDWNIYSPILAPIHVVAFPSNDNKSLEISDADPYDYAKAERVFEKSSKGQMMLRLAASQTEYGQLYIELCDAGGLSPIRIRFNFTGQIELLQAGTWQPIQPYETNEWVELKVEFDAIKHRFSLFVNDVIVKKGIFSMSVATLERLVLRTGESRRTPHVETPLITEDVLQPDKVEHRAVYHVNEVKLQAIERGNNDES